MRIGSSWKHFLPLLNGILFPSGCSLCGKDLPLREKGLCAGCRRSVDLFKEPPTLKPKHSLYQYGRPLARMIRKAKYEKRFEVVEDLLRRSDEWDLGKENIDLITSVPMTYGERFRRESDLSGLLARRFSKRSSVPYKRLLKKKRRTVPQSLLKRKQRLTNLEGAFTAQDTGLVQGKKILIVDDVMTTGATLREARRALKAARAKKVFSFALARVTR
jgi:ComF family protein